LGAVSTISAGDDVPFPNVLGHDHRIHHKPIPEPSPISAQIGGLHIIYVNAKGLPTLKAGGPFPYPDGTVFADDVHEFSVKDGSYVEGGKKAVTVMVKDAKKYATTGGWGFQVWAGGDPSKPLVPDSGHSVQACFVCHTPQKAQDYTLSIYIP
jgi:Cytochrome P460